MKKPEDIRISPKKKTSSQSTSKPKSFETSTKSHPAPPPPSSVMRENSVKKYSIKKRNDGGVYVETKYLHTVNICSQNKSYTYFRMVLVARTRLVISVLQIEFPLPGRKGKCKKKILPSVNARCARTTFQIFPFKSFKSTLKHTSKTIPRTSSS